MRFLLCFALGICSVSAAWATVQMPDRLLCASDAFPLHTNPLETYFSQHPEAKPELPPSQTNNQRGYIATFVVDEDKFLISDITVLEYVDNRYRNRSILDDVFPEDISRHLTDYSGILTIPRGQLVANAEDDAVDQTPKNNHTPYTDYWLVRIEQGIVLESTVMPREKYLEYQAIQFAAYRETEAYQQRYLELADNLQLNDPARLDRIMASFNLHTEAVTPPFPQPAETTLCSPPPAEE